MDFCFKFPVLIAFHLLILHRITLTGRLVLLAVIPLLYKGETKGDMKYITKLLYYFLLARRFSV